MSLPSAYLLISHGSRDPRHPLAMEKLAELVRIKLEIQQATRTARLGGDRNKTFLQGQHASSPQANYLWQRSDPDGTTGGTMVVSPAAPLVGTAALELADAPLHEQIRQFASVVSADCRQLQLLPVFLLPGVHVTEDIPKEVALAEASLGGAVALNQRPHLGAHPGLGKMLASQLATVNADAKILLSHGTRRRGGNEPVEVVAEQLGAVAAYWSVKPTLEEQLFALASAGHQQIAILPYFLFAGGITDAIARSVTGLQERFPKLQLNLCAPIGVSSELADLIVDLTRE